MGEIEIGEYIVEWDDEKAEINYKKHGIHFEDDEDRIKVIGKVGKILVVIYTERGEKYRIISARNANKRERSKYYGQYNYL